MLKVWITKIENSIIIHNTETLKIAFLQFYKYIAKRVFLVLTQLFVVICRVSQHKATHNMNSSNLAICLWPTLLRIDFTGKTYTDMTQMTRLPAIIVQTLIEQCGFFFHGEDEISEVVWWGWASVYPTQRPFCLII